MVEKLSGVKSAEKYEKNINIGIFGSHSAEEVGVSAKAAGLQTILICEKGREQLYTRYNKHLFDEIVVLDKFDMLLDEEIQNQLVERNTIFIPNRSFSVYLGWKNIENKFFVPIYGNKFMLKIEERGIERDQYWLLKRAGIRTPKEFKTPEEIDCLAVVKVQQKNNPLERAFFYPDTPEDFYKKANKMLKEGIISGEGLKKAKIEEFVVGPRFNANFQAYALEDVFGKFDFVGFDDRIQTNIGGVLKLPAQEQLNLKIQMKNEEIGHFGVTMRESKKPLVYEAAEKFCAAAKEEFPPGMVGLFALQGAVPYGEGEKPEFVVFDVSPRVPGCPCVGPTSPEMRRLSLKYKKSIESPIDLCMMEINYAVENGLLSKVVT